MEKLVSCEHRYKQDIKNLFDEMKDIKKQGKFIGMNDVDISSEIVDIVEEVFGIKFEREI